MKTHVLEDEMKNRSALLTLLGFLLTFSLVLTACGPTQAPAQGETPEEPAPTDEPAAVEPVTVTYWHTMSDPETAQLEAVISAFEAANPGVTIEATRFAYDDFKPALLTSLAGGEAPDTARLDIAWVSEFADQGALLELDTSMPDFDAIAANTFPGPLSTNYWNGHYYGLPQNTNTQVLLWNEDVFSEAGLEPPSTSAGFAEIACALSDPAK